MSWFDRLFGNKKPTKPSSPPPPTMPAQMPLDWYLGAAGTLDHACREVLKRRPEQSFYGTFFYHTREQGMTGDQLFANLRQSAEGMAAILKPAVAGRAGTLTLTKVANGPHLPSMSEAWYLDVAKTIFALAAEEKFGEPAPAVVGTLFYMAKEHGMNADLLRAVLQSSPEWEDAQKPSNPNLPDAGKPLDPAWGSARIVSGEVFADNRGPFVPVGLHFGEAFSLWCRGRKDEVRAEVRAAAQAGYDHIRTWGNLGFYNEAWAGREVAFTSFSNRSGGRVPETPNYYDELDSFAQMCAQEGMRILWSQGDMNSMGESQISAHLRRVKDVFARQPHVVFGVELANEKWQNFPSHLAEDQQVAVRIMRDAFGGTGWVLQNSACDPWWRPDSGESAEGFQHMVAGWFNCANVHGTRAFEDPEKVFRRHFNYGYERYVPGSTLKYAMQSTEPGGPGSGVTVGRTDQVWKLVGMHVSTLIGRSATVYMSSHGVFYNGRIADQPGYAEVAQLKTLFPSNAFTFTALHGNRPDAWFTSEGGFADAGRGYARVDQLVSESNGKGLCIAHHGRGTRRIISRRNATLQVYGLDLTPRAEVQVSAGQAVDVGGDAFFVATLR